tara:strand:- start:7043 stop:8179 length:1137 start_codon:yes stop_codon:yes gene_type:complete
MAKVIVTGILGQDGANMAQYLLDNTNHEVFGAMRRSAAPNYINVEEFRDHDRFHLVFLDLVDANSIEKVVTDIQPDYFVNFAANSFVGISWTMPEQVFDVNALGVLRCLEAIKKIRPSCRFYSAGSSEEFGDVDYSPQDLNHPIKPRSPYGASKSAARGIVKVYRESYDLYAVHGILFNHEGPKRGEEFVTRKITKGVARIKVALEGNQKFDPIELGNLDSQRDWSDSRDFVKGVWMMVNQDEYRKEKTGEVKDYLLSSGKTYSVREFIKMAFEAAGIKIKWSFRGTTGNSASPENEVVEDDHGSVLVRINPKFYRPADVDLLLGDSSLIREELGWKPEIDLWEMVKDMVNKDIGIESHNERMFQFRAEEDENFRIIR